MKNKIVDLRDHLFATLEALQDKENPMELERALAIAQVADRIIDSAKVEVKFMEVVGHNAGTGFIPDNRPVIDGSGQKQLTGNKP